jgi:hypothetical protein
MKAPRWVAAGCWAELGLQGYIRRLRPPLEGLHSCVGGKCCTCSRQMERQRCLGPWGGMPLSFPVTCRLLDVDLSCAALCSAVLCLQVFMPSHLTHINYDQTEAGPGGQPPLTHSSYDRCAAFPAPALPCPTAGLLSTFIPAAAAAWGGAHRTGAPCPVCCAVSAASCVPLARCCAPAGWPSC